MSVQHPTEGDFVHRYRVDDKASAIRADLLYQDDEGKLHKISSDQFVAPIDGASPERLREMRNEVEEEMRTIDEQTVED